MRRILLQLIALALLAQPLAAQTADDIIARYGADTVRLTILFMGPADQDMEWTPDGAEGIGRFLRRLWRLVHEVADDLDAAVERVVRRLQRRVDRDARSLRLLALGRAALEADDAEMTRTRKVRRGHIAEKYQVLVDALYGGKSEQFIETAVKFEDGRSGSVSATLKIIDVKTFPAMKRAA